MFILSCIQKIGKAKIRITYPMSFFLNIEQYNVGIKRHWKCFKNVTDHFWIYNKEKMCMNDVKNYDNAFTRQKGRAGAHRYEAVKVKHNEEWCCTSRYDDYEVDLSIF